MKLPDVAFFRCVCLNQIGPHFLPLLAKLELEEKLVNVPKKIRPGFQGHRLIIFLNEATKRLRVLSDKQLFCVTSGFFL